MRLSTICIIEDDEILRSSYEYYIEGFENYKLLGSFKSVEDALRHFNDLRPDIILSDITLGGISGIEGISEFKTIDKKVKIVMVSVHDDIDFIKNSFKNLADGYLTKPVGQPALLDALNKLNDDIVPLSNAVARKMIQTYQGSSISFLTNRENQILEFLTRGLTYKSIADTLSVSVSTINFHVQNIYLKLEVTSKSEALAKAKEIQNTQQ